MEKMTKIVAFAILPISILPTSNAFNEFGLGEIIG